MANKKSSQTKKRASPKAKKTNPETMMAASQPKETAAVSRMAPAWTIFGRAIKVLVSQPKLFLGIAALYALANLIFVQTALFTDVNNIRDAVSDALPSSNRVVTSLALFSYMLSTGNAGNAQAASTYQFLLVLLFSLAIVWVLREVVAGHIIRIRDGFYRGMHPLVPVLLVGLVAVLSFVPMALSSWIFGLVVAGGIAINSFQLLLLSILPIGGFLLSMYWLTTTTMAVYIATLPDMTPMRALRSARELVIGRRWTVIRKLLFLPLVIGIGVTAIMLPFLLFVTVAAPWILFVLSIGVLLVVHSYMYALYRELLL